MAKGKKKVPRTAFPCPPPPLQTFRVCSWHHKKDTVKNESANNLRKKTVIQTPQLAFCCFSFLYRRTGGNPKSLSLPLSTPPVLFSLVLLTSASTRHWWWLRGIATFSRDNGIQNRGSDTCVYPFPPDMSLGRPVLPRRLFESEWRPLLRFT